MSDDEIKQAALAVLVEIAPEIKADEIDPEVNFRDQFDFDSMDFLNFALGLSKRMGVEIPEIDYPKLSSLSGCIAYFAPKLAGN